MTSGTAFIFRAIEPCDQARAEDHDFAVSGTKVTNRLYERTTDGEGTATFQVLIPDDGTLTSAGKVMIRLTYTGVNVHYEPSIADAWLIATS